MKKGKSVYLLVFAIILSVISLYCSTNIILSLISGAGTVDVVAFFNDLSILFLSFSALLNALAGIIISIILIVKKCFKTCAIITLTACICSLIGVLAGILI